MRKTATFALTMTGLLMSPVTGQVEAARGTACPGTVTLTGQSNLEVRTRGGRTFTEFDFIAVHTLCLRDGEVVDEAPQSGHMWIKQRADGSGGMRFVSTLSHEGDTLEGDGRGKVATDGAMAGRVRVHSGTGSLAGTTSRGWFRSAGPGQFEDFIWYRYR